MSCCNGSGDVLAEERVIVHLVVAHIKAQLSFSPLSLPFPALVRTFWGAWLQCPTVSEIKILHASKQRLHSSRDWVTSVTTSEQVVGWDTSCCPFQAELWVSNRTKSLESKHSNKLTWNKVQDISLIGVANESKEWLIRCVWSYLTQGVSAARG